MMRSNLYNKIACPKTTFSSFEELAWVKNLKVRLMGAILGIMALTLLTPGSGYGQSSCPKPVTFSTACTSGIAQCGSTGGSCSYTTSFSTSFTGNNKYVSITIYANGSQVHQECLGPLSSGTQTYSVSYNAACGASISGSYVAYTNSSSKNPCGGTTCESGTCSNGVCGQSILPITLKSFDARMEGKQVELEWITSSEQNNDHFRLERSKDGNNWSGIYTMMGSGNSNIESRYEVMDDFPFSGLNYYRLIQVDYDGTENVSGIISVNVDILQRPFKFEHATNSIVISDQLTEPVLTAVIDLQGRIISSQRVSPGSILPLEEMSTGMYVIRLYSKEINHSEKILVNR
ncbi:MAG: T9SS type A sorting domain-containing protein [Saprospiraceae bacterium]|nr:T9SS type A sorting domain-containing protein [Saprospiraceae bacterium]